MLAVRALNGCDLRLLLFRISLHNSVNPRVLLVDIFYRQVGLGFKHCRVDRAPHHHLDDTFLHAIVSNVRNP